MISSTFLMIRRRRIGGGAAGVSFLNGHPITFVRNQVYQTGAVDLRSREARSG